MCGYYYSNISPIEDTASLKRRGPDAWNEFSCEFGHVGAARLTTIKTPTEQPILKDHGVLLYNGSIYNDQSMNDTQWISQQLDSINYADFIPLVKTFEGEYSITWATARHVIFCTDVFGTRPLYYYYDENGITIASLPDGIQAKHNAFYRCEENRIYIFDKETKKLTSFKNKTWNLNQTVNNYDKVWELWEKAVKDRYTEQASILMSSGYDSGMIACTASKFFKNLDCYSIYNEHEHQPTLAKRQQLHNIEIINLDPTATNTKSLSNNYYKNKEHPFHQTMVDMSPDNPILKTNTYCNAGDSEIYVNHMKPKGKRIIIGGDGGDDIYSDYGFKGHRMRKQSRFGGLFPQDLDTVWPWIKDNVFVSYHGRTEKVGGYWGIEYRCPFMSNELIQAWLNTTQQLKNARHKGWMAQYMEDHDYPYASLEKFGHQAKMGYWNQSDR